MPSPLSSLCRQRRVSLIYSLILKFIVSKDTVGMDPEKVRAVKDWPTLSSCKQLQHFLRFANFYSKFIKNFITVASPLHSLTSANVPFTWSKQAEAFNLLKEKFTTAPVLVLPDAQLQFVVEIDASDVGVGAVLSQQALSGRLHRCAFLSWKLSAAEHIYDIGNRELLAVKAALEEWRHWLKQAELRFPVWTDHKNLEYLQTAKRFNSCQACWTLS